ncbi:hypothetical protein P3S68_013056 [Capsicum galapagoense]
MAFECPKGKSLRICSIEPSKNRDSMVLDSENKKSLYKLDVKGGIMNLKCDELVVVNKVVSDCRLITELPEALISEIFNRLEPKELAIVSCASTLLYWIASKHHVWKEFYCERWGEPILCAKSWKELFVEREFLSNTFMGRYTIDMLYGHTEDVRTVFILSSEKLVFTSGYDKIVRIWDLEERRSIASSPPLGCTIRAVAADSRLLVAGGSDGFIHGWRANDGNPHLFDLSAPPNQDMEFQVWEHDGPITCLALDFNRMYSGSWDMSIRVWDRSSLECLKVLIHSCWVWNLAPHDTTVVSTAGSDLYVWDTNSGSRLDIISNAHVGYTFSLARSHNGKLLFTGGEDGAIHMFEIFENARYLVRRVATWNPHLSAVYSLAFEFPWLVSASSDGKLSLIDVRKLRRTNRNSAVEPPQRMLHSFGSNVFAVVDVGCNRIVCSGEKGAVRIWNFSQALEIEQRIRDLRGLWLENRIGRRIHQLETSGEGRRGGQCSFAEKNRMGRRIHQLETNGEGRRGGQCSFAEKKNQLDGDRNKGNNSYNNRRRMVWKVKAPK